MQVAAVGRIAHERGRAGGVKTFATVAVELTGVSAAFVADVLQPPVRADLDAGRAPERRQTLVHQTEPPRVEPVGAAVQCSTSSRSSRAVGTSRSTSSASSCSPRSRRVDRCEHRRDVVDDELVVAGDRASARRGGATGSRCPEPPRPRARTAPPGAPATAAPSCTSASSRRRRLSPVGQQHRVTQHQVEQRGGRTCRRSRPPGGASRATCGPRRGARRDSCGRRR